MNNYQSGLASLFSTHARRADRAPKVVCSCGEEYTLGVDGTVDGCDECNGIVRTPNGYVIEEAFCTGTDPVRCDDENCPRHGKG